MKKIVFIFLSLMLSFSIARTEVVTKNSFQERAEAELSKGNSGSSRALYLRAYDDYVNKGRLSQGVECGVKASTLYYKENLYTEAFDLLRSIDQQIDASKNNASEKAALHYQTSRERFMMYMKMRRGASAQDHLAVMERHAGITTDENVKNDLLYNKTVYYYTFGQNDKGNATFREMATKLTSQKEYDKVDEVYRTLIANGLRSSNASIVAQSYSSYMVWKDSVAELKRADEVGTLKQQIAENEVSIADKDSSLANRRAIIIGLSILAASLAAALVVGGVILLRFIILTRKQKKTIKEANDNNALKAQFISNISAQLEPTLAKLDNTKPEVKALLDFSSHVQQLANLENSNDEPLALEDTQIASFSEEIANEVRTLMKKDVVFTVNVPKMNTSVRRDYVRHILLHLLKNAAEYTPEGGHVTLEYKKRSAHKYQFLVSNTGSTIADEAREDIFKPFRKVRDLTTGDGLGLPICKQMALKMNGDLNLDSAFVKGVRFVLDLQA